jgi:hypothetical protein
MPYLFRLDSLNFPYLFIPYNGENGGFWFSLFPLTKFQFESFLATPNSYSDSWYEEILSLNPRFSKSQKNNFQSLFITGIFHHEALEFAHWLGNDYDLPTEAEWRQAYIYLSKLKYNDQELMNLLGKDNYVDTVIQVCTKSRKVTDWVGAVLMTDGIFEWVRMPERANKYGIYGSASKVDIISHPLRYIPEIPSPSVLNECERPKSFGARLIIRK